MTHGPDNLSSSLLKINEILKILEKSLLGVRRFQLPIIWHWERSVIRRYSHCCKRTMTRGPDYLFSPRYVSKHECPIVHQNPNAQLRIKTRVPNCESKHECPIAYQNTSAHSCIKTRVPTCVSKHEYPIVYQNTNGVVCVALCTSPFPFVNERTFVVLFLRSTRPLLCYGPDGLYD